MRAQLTAWKHTHALLAGLCHRAREIQMRSRENRRGDPAFNTLPWPHLTRKGFRTGTSQAGTPPPGPLASGNWGAPVPIATAERAARDSLRAGGGAHLLVRGGERKGREHRAPLETHFGGCQEEGEARRGVATSLRRGSDPFDRLGVQPRCSPKDACMTLSGKLPARARGPRRGGR